MTSPSSCSGDVPKGAHRHPARRRLLLGTSSIGAFLDESGEAVVVVSGAIDTTTVERLADHLDDLLDSGVRFLTIAAAAVASYGPELLDLLGRIQDDLGRRHGHLRVRGLNPRLRGPAGPEAVPDGESNVGSSRPDNANDRGAGIDRPGHGPDGRYPGHAVTTAVTIETLATELRTDPQVIVDRARQLIASGAEKVLTVGHPIDEAAPVTCLTDQAATAIRTQLHGI